MGWWWWGRVGVKKQAEPGIVRKDVVVEMRSSGEEELAERIDVITLIRRGI
jgi:hypothetical protein